MERGCIHIYCGNGKGKTTAGMGLCLRAAGHGMRVGIAQFLKPGNSGELVILKQQPNVQLLPFLPDVKFTVAMTEREKRDAKEFYASLLEHIRAQADHFDVLLLDEVFAALSTGLLDSQALVSFLRGRPEPLEVILTGRNPPAEVLELADYISEVQPVRHPFEHGVAARKGIEW